MTHQEKQSDTWFGKYYRVTLKIGEDRVVDIKHRSKWGAHAIAERVVDEYGYVPDIHDCEKLSNRLTATRIYPAEKAA
ncbi:hypothetical protein [Roseovarius indicus]|uniref:Uncharacterized protein n=1 Tax=Roseovarius indicus TaxID=540747 RepID=A0A0T5P939_9RHOB|nr:hypothetical protein [Roseovarius indicus]KRS17508.1 hypothetical protein XM52_13580 [Roseovarius indicus]QEW26709.1 hypothetical protein RIdsm_02511 [Roseovarius indicus]SFD61282.1 hypothetical protein SAMN04488031_101831 [Roseovarius indicus]